MRKYFKFYIGAFLSIGATLSLASAPDLNVINDGPKAIIITPGFDIGRISSHHGGYETDYLYGGDDPCNTVLHDQHSDSLTIQPGEKYQIVDASQHVDKWWTGHVWNDGNYCSYVVSVVGSSNITHLVTSVTDTIIGCEESDYFDCKENGDGRITDAYYDGNKFLHIATPK